MSSVQANACEASQPQATHVVSLLVLSCHATTSVAFHAVCDHECVRDSNKMKKNNSLRTSKMEASKYLMLSQTI